MGDKVRQAIENKRAGDRDQTGDVQLGKTAAVYLSNPSELIEFIKASQRRTLRGYGWRALELSRGATRRVPGVA